MKATVTPLDSLQETPERLARVPPHGLNADVRARYFPHFNEADLQMVFADGYLSLVNGKDWCPYQAMPNRAVWWFGRRQHVFHTYQQLDEVRRRDGGLDDAADHLQAEYVMCHKEWAGLLHTIAEAPRPSPKTP